MKNEDNKKPLRNSLVLFVPFINRLAGDDNSISEELKEAFVVHKLSDKLHYLPITYAKPTPDMGRIPIAVKVRGIDLTLRFAVNEQQCVYNGIHYTEFNVLVLPVYLLCTELYPTDFLVRFFKENWSTSINL